MMDKMCKLCHTRYSGEAEDEVCPACVQRSRRPIDFALTEERPAYESHIVYRKAARKYNEFLEQARNIPFFEFEAAISEVLTKWDRGISFVHPEERPRGWLPESVELQIAADCLLSTIRNQVIEYWVKHLTKEDATALCKALGKDDTIRIGKSRIFVTRDELYNAWEWAHLFQRIDLPYKYEGQRRVLL